MKFRYHLPPCCVPYIIFRSWCFFIIWAQNIDQCNQTLCTLIEEECLYSCHSHPNRKKGRKSQLKSLVWDFKGLGRNGTSGKWERDLHGKSLRGHLLLHGLCLWDSWRCSPRGAANKQSTSRDIGLCLWEKDNQWTFKSRGWDKAYNTS